MTPSGEWLRRQFGTACKLVRRDGLIAACLAGAGAIPLVLLVAWALGRSEEHTSELQSRGQLVCRLLLEKKRESHDLFTRRLRTDDSVSGLLLIQNRVRSED